MTRDLPNSIPSAVRTAAENAVTKDIDNTARRIRAKDAYQSFKYREHANAARAHVMYDDLLAKAQALVDWGARLREALPADELCRRFQTNDFCRGPYLSVVRHELVLTESDGFPGGRLTNELELELDGSEGLFRNHVWFENFRMTGGGLLNTANGLHLALHPEALNQIHGLVADGQNWRHIELGFNRLVDGFKDR